MRSKFKRLLSKILIAHKTNKVGFTTKLSYTEVSMLDFLWLQGIIFGYVNHKKNKYYIYLKYTQDNFLFNNVKFLNNYVDNKHLGNVSILESNSTYCVSTVKGIYTQGECHKKGLGGYVFAKI
jgi:ribosomal protein S8